MCLGLTILKIEESTQVGKEIGKENQKKDSAFTILLAILVTLQKKPGYCGEQKPAQNPKKPQLKAHLAYYGGCYCGGSTPCYALS